MASNEFTQYQLPADIAPSLDEQQKAIGASAGVTPFYQTGLTPPAVPTVGDYIQPQGGNLVLTKGAYQSENYVKGLAGWQITDGGNAEFNTGTFRGQLIAGSVDIPDTTSANSFHVNSSGDSWWGSASIGTATASITKAGLATFTNVVITGGTVATTTLNKAVMGWTSNMVFTSASAVQVNWSSGSIKMEDNTTYTISAGNTSTMAALTYIYLDTAVSTTVLQTTTTYSTATGDNKILIAMAQNNTVGASVIPLGGGQPIIDGTAQITALSITAASIAASTITAAKLTVSQLSAIAADMGSITAGTIVLSSSGYFRSGQTDYATGTGFFLGISGGATKFSIGSATNFITWDGTTLSIQGVANVSKSYTSGAAVTAGDAVCAYYYQADGGILFDAKAIGSGTKGAGGGTVSQSFTVANNTNRALIVFIAIQEPTSLAENTPTYNAVGMTQVGRTTRAGGYTFTSWRLFAPTTGANTFSFVLAASGGAGWNYAYAIYSYYNVSQSAIDGHIEANGNAPSATATETSTADNTLVVTGIMQTGTGATLTSTVNMANNTQSDTAVGVSLFTGDCGHVFPKANVTVSGTASTGWLECAVGLAPVTAPTFGVVVPASASSTANAANGNKYNSFIGFAKTTVAVNTAVAVTIAGEVTGLSGLTATGGFYYLANAAGTISTTAGTNTRKVGINITTTSLLITNIW